MLTDEQYGRQLGVQLRHEMADVHAAPDLIRTLRRRQARRAWAIRAAMATPVAVAAAAAILVTPAGTQPSGGGRQTHGAAPSASGSPVQLETVAHVKAQTMTALSRASQYVLFAKSTYAGGRYDTWIDKATQRYRNDVYQPTYAAGPVSRDGTVQAPPAPTEETPGPIHLAQSHSATGPEDDQYIVTVDYDLKKWWTDHVSDKNERPVAPDITDADSIRKAITDGTLELLGAETVNGRDTLHLRLFGPNRSYRIDMWVDSKTYLPVQEASVKRSGETGGQAFPASATVTTKYSWLPRTKENLAYLVLTPPPGFEHVR